LAFQSGDTTRVDDRLGIMVGSLLSGIAGYLLRRSTTGKDN